VKVTDYVMHTSAFYIDCSLLVRKENWEKLLSIFDQVRKYIDISKTSAGMSG